MPPKNPTGLQRLLRQRQKPATNVNTHQDSQTDKLGEKSQDIICKKCAKINFEEIFAVDANRLWDAGIVVDHLGKRCVAPVDNGCALCDLFSKAIPRHDKDAKSYDLRITSFSKIYGGVLSRCMPEEVKDSDQVCLLVAPRKSRFSKSRVPSSVSDDILLLSMEGAVSDKMFSPQKLSQQCNLTAMSELISYCRNNHSTLCTAQHSRPQALKLIDCKSLFLVNASPSDEYFALSYVWDHTQTTAIELKKDGETATDALSRLPNVIRDAISVTNALGFQYLWVDKFCIDQDNETEKASQINQMDLIYQHAELTIIAATSDEQSGLPGIGTTPRKAQPVAHVGSITIASTMTSPNRLIRKSKWASRGWTYQEGILSRRRLVFTDSQMYFECNAMNCAETLLPNLALTHIADRSRMAQFISPGIFSEHGPPSELPDETTINETEWDMFYIERHIARYAARQLTFDDTDILNAFQGILKSFQRRDRPVFHLWGTPFFDPKAVSSAHAANSFARALLWRRGRWATRHTTTTPTPPLAVAVKKRDGMPSWSWACCKGGGGVNYGLLDKEFGYSGFASLLSAVDLETEPEKRVEMISLFQKAQPEDLDRLFYPTALHLQGWVSDSTFPPVLKYQRGEQWRLMGSPAWLVFSCSESITEDHVNEMVSEGKWVFLALGKLNRANLLGQTFFLIIDKSTEVPSRVGFAYVYCEWDYLRTIGKWNEETIRLA